MITPNKVTLTLGVLILIIPSLALLGWNFDVPFLVSISANMTAMNPVTAVTFVLIATWVVLPAERKNKPLQIIKILIALLVFLTGTLRLFEYAGTLHLHMDRLLFPTKLSNRMLHNSVAPTTAFIFTLLGIVLFNPGKGNKYKSVVNDIILFCAFLISYVGVIGYVYSLDTFYRIGPFVPMALNTAICFNLSVTALFLINNEGLLYRLLFSRLIGGKLLRKAIPLVLIIPPAFGYSKILFQDAHFYSAAYSVALDTAFLVMVVLAIVFYYGSLLNKNDAEREIAEKQIIQNEEKYRSLVFSMKEGVIYFDTALKILFYNPSFCKLTGYGPDELIGSNIRDTLLPEEYRDGSNERIAERFKGISEEYESYFLRKNGEKFAVNINSTPLYKDGKPASFLCTLTDITERKKREEDIEAFSASAAHDLNAPLGRIQMLTGFIIDDSREHLNVEDIENLEIISKTSGDMRMLLQDLLLFAKIGAEKINREYIDMNKMAKEIIAGSGPLKACIQVDDLPVAQGEKSAIKQVWANLIHNAIKYSSKKKKPVVHIGCLSQNGRTVYYVKDNGAGFNMAEAGKLFIPFKRLHLDFEGNGLGLPIVKRIIEKHNGKIWAESEPGKGAAFYFYL
jgi:PAS domain S-box-containing protein